jgi:hypothetical protein
LSFSYWKRSADKGTIDLLMTTKDLSASAQRGERGGQRRLPDAMVERLRRALELKSRARAELSVARGAESAALAELRAMGYTWWSIASGLVPIRDRKSLARRLRQRTWKLRAVAMGDNKARAHLPAKPLSPVTASLIGASSREEAKMPERVVKRTVTTTEEVFAGEDDLDGADDDDPEEEEEEADEVESNKAKKPKSRAKR